MKRSITTLIVAIFALLLCGNALQAEEPAIYLLPPEAESTLIQMKATVRHARLDGDLVAQLSVQEVDELISAGFSPELLYHSTAEESRIFDATDDFHTYSELRDGSYALAAAYPNIAQLEVFGSSVQNRELFGIRITSNPMVEENEPTVVFCGCIHGNEYAAAEIPYLYAYYLCENYGVDPVITEYIDNNEIWCIPMINPDGRANGTRENANGIDLNREFGYNWDGWGGSSYPFSQIESRKVREFLLDNNASLSIVYHTSGNEFYYPWGFFPHQAPDYDILYRVSERYANAASYAFMSSFQSYQTHGEVLDWAYGCFGGLSYTAELSNWSSQVQQTFERNLTGMNFYCQIASEGLHGMVTDAQTNEPLWAAVWIDGNPIPVYTDPQIGDAHRVVLPGTYNLTVWANGYHPQTVNNVTVSYGSPGVFSAELEPADSEHAFMVTSVNQDDPNNAYNNVTYPAWALGEPDGLPCSIGSDGFIVLDMGEGHEIIDGPGDDFTVTEVIHPRDPDPEAYRVYAGNAYNQNTPLGNGMGTTSFDLGAAGVTSTRYLKIEDNSGAPPSSALAGMDLDAITILNGADALMGETDSEMIMPEEFNPSVYPNPFNPTTAISYQLSAFSYVNHTVFDIQGREVAKLVNDWRDAGVHEVTLDGSGLSSGIYIFRVTAGNFTASGKMVLIK